MKKIISLLLILLLSLSLCACELTDTYPDSEVGGGAEEQEKLTSLEQISLVYFDDKGLHPLLETSKANQQVNLAVFLPAFTFDEGLNIQYGCATAASMNGTSVTITPDTSRRFSDGSSLTPNLMAESFRFVMQHPESPYHRRLKNVESVSVQSGMVILHLKEADPAALYCMDIPIVKESDKKYYGCGDYMLSKYQNVPALVANPHSPTAPVLAPITLLDPAAESSMAAMFNSGVLDAISSDMMASGTLSISREYKSVGYLTNTMLYMGVNTEREALNREMRQALSLLLPRQDIVDGVLMGGGTATARPLYPKWNVLPEETVTTAEKAELLAAFEKAGLIAKNGELFTADGKKPSFDLLVSEESKTHSAAAEKLRSAAATLGLEITVVTVSADTFMTRLKNGNFDLFIARFALNSDMDPTELYAAESEYNYGGADLTELTEAWDAWKRGEKSMSEYLTLFASECPILPIAFVKNSLYYTEGISPAGQISASAPLGNLSRWSAK